MQAASEDSRLVEVSKLQKGLETLKSELDAERSAVVGERNKNGLLVSQLEEAKKNIATLQTNLNEMEELNKQNSLLRVTFFFFLGKNKSPSICGIFFVFIMNTNFT